MSDYIFTSRYAQYVDELHRRETPTEAINRCLDMHLRKYSYLSKEDKDTIRWAFDMVHEGKVMPSMRSLQFGGRAIEANSSRIFNCSVRHVDSPRAFAEIFFLLLSGCGVGFGLHPDFLSRLPNLVTAADKTGTVITYVVEDTVEGWSDSIEALLSCYFKNTPFSGRKIAFDFSKIRKKGARLKTSGGKAPGHVGLKQALGKIKALLDHAIEVNGQARLRSVDAHDIICHMADAVLSGGVRRSALISLFVPEDTDMMSAKVNQKVDEIGAFKFIREETLGGRTSRVHAGWVVKDKIKYDIEVSEGYELDLVQNEGLVFWNKLYPQRARANNSVILVRDETSQEKFREIVELARQWGEPGYLLTDHKWALTNPCFVGSTRILTQEGWRSLESLLDKQPVIVQDNRVTGKLEEGKETWDVDMLNIGATTNKVESVFLTGRNKEVWELELSCGRKVTATPNHHFATPEGMVELKDLNIGDRILTAVPNIYKADKDSLDYKAGYLAGVIQGDGSLTSTAAHIDIWTNEDFEALRNVERYAAEVVQPEDSTSSTRWPSAKPTFNEVTCATTGNIRKYRLSSHALRRALIRHGFVDKKSLSWLHEKSKDFKSGFMSGFIYADAHVDYNKTSKSLSIRLCQSNLEVLQDAQLILQELGTFSRIANLRPEGISMLPNSKREMVPYNTKASFRLMIAGKVNCSLIGNWATLSSKMTDRLREISEHSTNRMPFIEYTSKVKSKTFVGREDVYCLKEDNRRTLIAEGITARRCAEILFVPITEDGVCGVQFCNLTTINGSKVTSLEDYLLASKASAIIGTLQAGYTNFPYLSPAARKLTEEEALLGCSITGIMSSPDILLNPEYQQLAARTAVDTNEEWAGKLGINPAARVTCVKPEGTSSAYLKTTSGIHGDHGKAEWEGKYFRRVQCNKVDNVYEHFKKANPHMCEESVWSAAKTDDVITFALQASPTAVLKESLSAIEHLDIIKSTQQHWVVPGTGRQNRKPVHHSVSCTVLADDEDWDKVAEYLYENRTYFSAVSLLPRMGDKLYMQAPFEAVCSEEDLDRWNKLQEESKPVDYTKLREYTDNTTRSDTAACAGGACEVNI